MPTPQGITAANAQTTDEAWLMLVAIDHASFAAPIRVAGKAVEHQGDAYVAFPFQLTPPDDAPDERPVGRLIVDDVGEFEIDGEKKTIGDVVKAIPVGENVSVTLTIVLDSDPDLIEMGPMDFTLRNVRGDGLTVEGDLYYEDILNEPFPCDSMPS